jgi:hypothetical protein
MYAGHAAFATLVKGKRPRLSLALLVPVAFGPDWVDMVTHVVHRPNPELSHSLVSVGIVATVLTLCLIPILRSAADALIVGGTYVSHWLLDCVTGIKPTWPGGPEIGMHLYARMYRDFVLESLIVVACWLVYRASLRSDVRNALATYAMPLGLIVMQLAFTFVQAPAAT